jgi:L-ascorbate metabolism protein UlaG (beta-lactamase superfamily)
MMSKANEIRKLFASSLGKDEVAFMYLGYSGVIVRTSNRTIIIDPAELLGGEEIKALKGVDLLLFTHNHGDHYRSGVALDIFKATGAPVLAEPLVANDLKGKVSSDKLTSASAGKTYNFNGIMVSTIQGIHRGPIILYHLKIGDISIFHGGDSGYVPVKDYPADLAFLPTGSPSPTASPENALKMASELKPSIVVTIHGSEVQSKEFEGKVKENLPKTTVIITEPYLTKTVALQKKT